MRKKNYKCLMIETSDNQRFFTHERNYRQLIEFANTFEAAVSVVRVEEADILDLAPLATAISTSSNSENVKFNILETKIEKSRKKVRRDLSEYSKQIETYITTQFTDGVPVSMKEIQKKHAEWNLYPAFFSNHISKVKKNLERTGYKIDRIGQGTYQWIKTRPEYLDLLN